MLSKSRCLQCLSNGNGENDSGNIFTFVIYLVQLYAQWSYIYIPVHAYHGVWVLHIPQSPLLNFQIGSLKCLIPH